MLMLLLLLNAVKSKELSFSSGIDAQLSAKCSHTGNHEVTVVPTMLPGWTSFDNAKWVWVNSTVPETCNFTGLGFQIGKNAKASLQIAADDSVKLFINNKAYDIKNANSSHIEKIDLKEAFNKKKYYEVSFQVTNKDTRGGLAFHLDIKFNEERSKVFWILVGLSTLVGTSIIL